MTWLHEVWLLSMRKWSIFSMFDPRQCIGLLDYEFAPTFGAQGEERKQEVYEAWAMYCLTAFKILWWVQENYIDWLSKQC